MFSMGSCGDEIYDYDTKSSIEDSKSSVALREKELKLVLVDVIVLF